MKLDGMKCPHCGSSNTYAWNIERASIWDDRTYAVLRKEFGEDIPLSGSVENVIYTCKCNGCEKHFSSMAILDVKIKKMITRKNIEEIEWLKVSEVAEDEQSKD